MSAVLTVIPLLGLMLVTMQAAPTADAMRALARDAPDSVLVANARGWPDETRNALRDLLREAAGSRSDPDGALAAAERLADAYVAAWGDPFLRGRVAQFRSMSAAERRAVVAADSVRLAGNAELASAGVDAAMRAWRESHRRFATLGDTAGMAAALGNIGIGFYHSEAFDSAEAYLERSRDFAERAGDLRTAANALGGLASVSLERGELRRARELYERATSLRGRSGDAMGLVADQNNVGLIALELGDLSGARRAFETALAANRSAGRTAPAADNLVNLGNVASAEGDYAEAASHYAAALAAYRDGGHRMDAALVLHNIGLLGMRRGDYRTAIRRLSEAVRIHEQTGPLPDELAVRQDLASAHAAAGDLEKARVELTRAESLTAGLDTRAELSARLALAQADLAVRINQLADAERQFVRAERLARDAGDQTLRAAAQHGAGLVLLMRERYVDALNALELALQAQATAGDRRGSALTRLLIGHALRRQGDTATARPTLLHSLDTLRAIGDIVGEASALGELGELELQNGLPLSADSLFRRALARLGSRPAPDAAWRLHAGRARALRSLAGWEAAARELRASIEEIERVAGHLPAEERRSAFLADKWEVYTELALVERRLGRVDAAFEASERLRARQMLDLLARGRIDVAPDMPSSLTAREQDLRRRIAELTDLLQGRPGEAPRLRGTAPDRDEVAAALEALARAQRAYGELLIDMREVRPAYAALVRGEVATMRDVMRALAPDQVLLEYLVSDSTALVFVVARDTMALLDLNLPRAALAGLVDFARGTLGSPMEGGVRQAWRAPLRRLHDHLIAPIEAAGYLDGKRRLLVAPHADLHYLPFAALVGPQPSGDLLVDRYVIEYVPSASVWLRLRDREAPAAPHGLLALAPRIDALPGSRIEVDAIRRVHGVGTRTLVGAAATEVAFRRLAPEHDIIHLATYGVLNKHNPLFSFVELGASGDDDGRLEVHEVFGLALNARLVVLSACQTGLAAGALADVPAGDDWVGLVRAFLFAGASNVVATLWPVEDRATARFVERFHRELAAGRREAEALAEAQRSAARDRDSAHPFYWAGFALVVGR